MSNKSCELCGKLARMFCESDQASLCWDCDEKVHSANFLVAKHCRILLCHACTSPTPWKAAGLNLGPAVSVCRACAENGPRGETERRSGVGGESQGNDDSQESESDDGEYYSESDNYSEEEEGEEEDGENQVVPWSICGSAPALAPPSSSCSEDEASLSSWKRSRDLVLESENEDGCCSSENPDRKMASWDLNFQESENSGSSSPTNFRPVKLRRTGSSGEELKPAEAAVATQNQGNSSSGAAAEVVDRLRRLRQEAMKEGGDTCAMILDICKLTRD